MCQLRYPFLSPPVSISTANYVLHRIMSSALVNRSFSDCILCRACWLSEEFGPAIKARVWFLVSTLPVAHPPGTIWTSVQRPQWDGQLFKFPQDPSSLFSWRTVSRFSTHFKRTQRLPICLLWLRRKRPIIRDTMATKLFLFCGLLLSLLNQTKGPALRAI
jgi:hypothetical protein